MARKRRAEKRKLLPDPKCGSSLVTQFVNCLFRKGKKSVGERIFYESLDLIKARTDKDGLEVFEKAVENVKPVVQVRSRRVGGANYQVPMQVNRKRQLSLGIRWIRDAVRSGKGKPTAVSLANELMAAYNGEGAALQTRENIHRMAEANKAFAHFAW